MLPDLCSSFTPQFRRSFTQGARELPRGYRVATWARTQEGHPWVTVGRYDSNFVIGLLDGFVQLTHRRTLDRVMGHWPSSAETGGSMIHRIAEALTA